MITLTFEEFFKDGQDILYKYNNLPTIYVVRNKSGNLLYIGKSIDNIYIRWFEGTSSHMVYMLDEDNNLRFGARSYIGQVIAANLPKSNNWLFDLWTAKEALEFLGFEIYDVNSDDRRYCRVKSPSPYVPDVSKTMRTEDAEYWMTAFLHPKYNVQNNNSFRDEEFYRKYFEFIKGWELVR